MPSLSLPLRLGLAALLLLPACSGDDGTASASESSGDTTSTSASSSGTTTASSSDSASTSATETGTATGTTTGDPVACTDTLPPEGSPCAAADETCAPDADPCEPYTEAKCTGGVWAYNDIGPGDPDECNVVPCDPDDLPAEGSPCGDEGEYCSPGCEDPCQFCNILQCDGGVWSPVEVFPAECLSCEEVCPFVLKGGCKGGPPDMEACVNGCMEYQSNDCKIAFNTMLACVGAEPTYTCDDDQRPTVEGCESQYAELYTCIFP
jgi:hypothetical protein